MLPIREYLRQPLWFKNPLYIALMFTRWLMLPVSLWAVVTVNMGLSVAAISLAALTAVVSDDIT